MRTLSWFAVWVVLLASVGAPEAQETVLEYPVGVLDLYDADDSCWVGMGASGEYPVPVVPSQWLVGPPPSEQSAVTFPEDHWVDFLFSGRIVNAVGDDLELTESGKAGEQAILFLTDGADREYAVAMAQADDEHVQALSYLSLDLPQMEVPFAPTGLRLVALDHGGSSPGFDLGYIRARISHECGPQSRYPIPVSKAVDVPADANLAWTPACDAGQQRLYFSEARSLVQGPDSGLPYVVLPADANSFEPSELHLGRTYYWRVATVDATDANVISAGDIWSFTVADRFVLDDFDAYNWWDNFLYQSWLTRSRGRVSLGSDRIYRSCRQSLVFSYYYSMAQYSETYHRFEPPQDWLGTEAAMLELWLYGDRNNATDGQMYMTLSDGVTEQRVLFAGGPEVLTQAEWTPWRVALSEFGDVNLASVECLTIGLSWPSAQSGQSGRGTIYIEDIALSPSMCLESRHPSADLTGDCIVGYEDLEQVATEWLNEPVHQALVASPNEPVLWYRFDGSAIDSAGRAHGQLQGRPIYAAGVYGQAICFLNRGDAVAVSDAAQVFEGIREAVTIAFWQNGEDSPHRNDTLCCSNFTYGVSNPSIAVHLGCWRDPGQYRWDCGSPWSFENRLAGRHRAQSEWMGAWNHWAFTKDIRVGSDDDKGEMRIYLNGVLYDSRSGTDAPIEEITSFTIGSGWYGHYDGLIDDFQIYDYALSEAEVAHLASDGTGQLPCQTSLSADLDDSDRVDLRDFGVLAEQWLDDGLWP